ncbi:hypothetical protein UF64_10165 [Thalassospira sp. HJ]|uniref:hypothetical protein n=1 Tax=Thalassospira sp. HJ TaxID=1616823 RepID=UPI0005CEABCD|nr:hypothetical protein [Thalassospira sp. HJ]KJE35052.1 hypothetical protein UF64_10165 [Thalassospira sp. HJ]
MNVSLYFPIDEIHAPKPNCDLAADYLELTAFFSKDAQAFTKDLVNASEIGAEEDYLDVDDEVINREEIISGAISRIDGRKNALGDSYPFSMDDNGDLLTFFRDELTHGQAAYLLCLVLSHLKSVSAVLDGTIVYPSDDDIRKLRQYFQYFATAALAAEIGGQAWSFGYPRPDHTGFLEKLGQIWDVLRDGSVAVDPAAPQRPKDDQIDIFAWKGHPDALPGFLLAGAQVATGNNWKDKSIKSHLSEVFWKRWFGRQPVSQMVCYHIIPFTRSDIEFRDDVLTLGNVLHRLRLPYRVEQAVVLHNNGVSIEAFDLLPEAVEWVTAYSQRAL